MKLKLSIFARKGDPKDLYICQHEPNDDAHYGGGKVWCDGHADYIRLAQASTCEFQDLDNKEEIIQQHVAGIDEKITDIRARANAAIEELTQRKRDLLQITFVPAGE